MVSARRGPQGRVEIDAAVVVRVAALPVAALAESRCAASWGRVQEILALRERLAVEGRRLAVELEPVIGAAEAGPERAALVALRRALYNTRRGRPVEVAGLGRRIAAWFEDLDRHDELVRGLPELLDRESRGAVEVLRRWVATDVFGYGVLQAGPAMSDALRRWLAEPPGGVPSRRLVLRLARYLARVVAKTSPHSTFMMTTLGRWGDDDVPVRWEGAWGWRSAVEPNVPLLLRLLSDLARTDDELAALFEVRANPSLAEDDGRLWFLTGREDAFTGVAVSAALRRRLRPPFGDPRERAGLVELGVLELLPPVADQADSHLTDLVDRLGTHPAGKALAVVRDVLARYPRAVGVDERAALGGQVRAALSTLGADLPDRNLFHENAVVGSPGPRLGLDAWRPALDDLRTVADFAAVFDRDRYARALAADLFAERIGAGAQVPFGRFHRMLGSSAELRALTHPWQTPAVLRDAQLAALRALPSGVIDPAVPAGLATGRAVGSVSCFVQTIGPPDETPVRLVLNGFGPGHGAMRSRVHRLLRVAGVRVGENRPLGVEHGLPVEISGLFGNNVNLRSPVASLEFGYPGVVPRGDVVGLGELAVRHGPDGLVLVRAGDGVRIRPVYTGMVAPLLLPRTARLLLQFFGDVPSPVMELAEIFSRPPEVVPDRIVRTERVSVGLVTVARAAWYVPAGEIPRRGGGSAAAHLLALAAWFAGHGLPERCFVSSRVPGAPVHERLRTSRLAKPTYLDLADPALVALFDRGLDTSGPMVVFHEPLPDFDAAVDVGGGGRHVSEYVVEVGRA
ncbi:lantibiotic dehydratase [Herbidospora yilanensis]|uniref:lantibiotic dehydratase n=1 Tax=Herbidospora yilanensis TaxID=354426 RepID=UPI000781AFB3|nr:lantibiotic dehydratase [Herbidospora yilanensis]